MLSAEELGSPRSVEYATAAAQVVPVLLLAAVVVPLRLARGRADSPKALLDLLLTSCAVGAGALAETVALFGVHQGGLTRSDARLLTLLLVLTAVLTIIRLLTPAIRVYAEGARVPEDRVWKIVTGTFSAVFIGLLFLLS